jgi:hypothetical protein
MGEVSRVTGKLTGTATKLAGMAMIMQFLPIIIPFILCFCSICSSVLGISGSVLFGDIRNKAKNEKKL